MNWQYRTILFEFRKDGLLGDKYIDDEEVEKVLNEQGGQGWELVSVTPVQEGLLAFFKRAAVQAPAMKAGIRPGEQSGAKGRSVGPAEPEGARIAGTGKPPAPSAVKPLGPSAGKPAGGAVQKSDGVGGIKIRS